MCQSRYANQITGTNTVPQRAAVSAMIGTEAAIGFLSRIECLIQLQVGATLSHALGQLGGASSPDELPSLEA